MKLSKSELFLYAIGIGYLLALFYPLIKAFFSGNKYYNDNSKQRSDWVEVPMLIDD